MPWNAFTTPIVVPSRPTRRGARRGQHGQAALHEHDLHEHLTLDRAFGRVDVRHRHGAVLNERLDLGERSAEHLGDVRLLVALGQVDGLGEVVLLEELGELRRELARLRLRRAQIPPLLDHDGQRPHRHDHEGVDDTLGEIAHGLPEFDH
ncbi:MAG: hypothetical protein ACYC1W_14320 [Gemmatimonadaceae bacterium]